LTDSGAAVRVGEIVNTHGVHGEVKILTETDTPEFLLRFKRLLIGGREYAVEKIRVHKGAVIAKLKTVDGVDAAQSLRGSEVLAYKSDAALPEGTMFVADIIGFSAADDETGKCIGKVTDYLALPSSGVYVITDESGKEILIPDVAEFSRGIDALSATIRFKLIEGL